MRNIHTVLLAACAAMAATTAQAQNTDNAPSAGLETIRHQSLTESSALSMMARGDNWTGTNAFKTLSAKNNSPLNRFNLATGYQRTGRLEQAKVLYQGLLVDGQFTMITAITPGAPRTFNAADEAASRLMYIQWLQEGGRKNVTTAQLSGAVSAEDAGVPVAAVVGGRMDDVSDEQAALYDRQGKPNGGVTP